MKSSPFQYLTNGRIFRLKEERERRKLFFQYSRAFLPKKISIGVFMEINKLITKFKRKFSRIGTVIMNIKIKNCSI